VPEGLDIGGRTKDPRPWLEGALRCWHDTARHRRVHWHDHGGTRLDVGMTDDKAGMTRYTVTEAARIMDVGTDAVRKRIQRNTIKHERINGTVYVWLDTDEPERDGTGKGHDQRHDAGVTHELAESYREQVEAYRDQVEFLRRELERKDTIIMTMAQRIPELEHAREPTPETRESPETASEEPYSTHAAPATPETAVSNAQHKRSWWRAFFGLE
jgi:hypothetical protein